MLHLLVLTNSAHAEFPTREDMQGYQAFKQRHDHKPFGVPEKMADRICFAEHFCALGGTAGRNVECEQTVELCLFQQQVRYGLRNPPSVAFSAESTRRCDAFFQSLTSAQKDQIVWPAGCEASPPASALRPVFTDTELNCVADVVCDGGVEGFEPICRRALSGCAQNMANQATGSERRACRDKWRLARNRCSLSLDPALGQPISAATGGQRSQPTHWREQVEEVSGNPDDIYDLGDLGDLEF